jgi:hypothetical protein
VPELRGLEPWDVARLLVAVGAYWSRHGCGPSWRQAARAADWTWREQRDERGLHSDELAERMQVLRRAGLVTFTREPYSLDATPAGRRWALATLACRESDQGRGVPR